MKTLYSVVKELILKHDESKLAELFGRIIALGNPNIPHVRNTTKTGVSDIGDKIKKKIFKVLLKDFKGPNIAMISGTALHESIQSLLKINFGDLSVSDEEFISKCIAITDELKCYVNSAVDLVLRDPNNKLAPPIVIDIKTTRKTVETFEATKDGYIEQLNWYCGELGCKIGFLLVLRVTSPSDMVVNSFNVILHKFDQAMYDKSLKHYTDYFTYLNSGKLPKCEYNEQSCYYCPYKIICTEFLELYGSWFRNGIMSKDAPKDVQSAMNSIWGEFGMRVSNGTRFIIWDIDFMKLYEAQEQMVADVNASLLEINKNADRLNLAELKDMIGKERMVTNF